MSELRYAKRSVQIDGKIFNIGDIIPDYITDEAAIAMNAFDEHTVCMDVEKAVEDLVDEQIPADDDEEVFTIIEEGAELLQSDEAIEAPVEVEEVKPATVVTPAAPAKGKGKK